MKKQTDATLTGSDSTIDGVINHIAYSGFTDAYEFRSFDGTLHLVIAKDDNGHWTRVDGTEPYLSGWVDELAEQISK